MSGDGSCGSVEFNFLRPSGLGTKLLVISYYLPVLR